MSNYVKMPKLQTPCLLHLFVTGQQNISGDNEPGWVYYVGAFAVPGRKHFAPRTTTRQVDLLLSRLPR